MSGSKVHSMDFVVDKGETRSLEGMLQDVAFIFPLEGSRLTAHRLILAAQCEGFKEVFHGVEAQEVEVVAATLEEFQLFLRSVYNLEVTWAALPLPTLLAVYRLQVHYRVDPRLAFNQATMLEVVRGRHMSGQDARDAAGMADKCPQETFLGAVGWGLRKTLERGDLLVVRAAEVMEVLEGEMDREEQGLGRLGTKVVEQLWNLATALRPLKELHRMVSGRFLQVSAAGQLGKMKKVKKLAAFVMRMEKVMVGDMEKLVEEGEQLVEALENDWETEFLADMEDFE